MISAGYSWSAGNGGTWETGSTSTSYDAKNSRMVSESAVRRAYAAATSAPLSAGAEPDVVGERLLERVGVLGQERAERGLQVPGAQGPEGLVRAAQVGVGGG